MYEKKNKLIQPAPTLDKISALLLDAVHRNINEKGAIFFKTLYCFLLFKVLSIYERFLSNNFGTEIIQSTQHLWQIYLFE